MIMYFLIQLPIGAGNGHNEKGPIQSGCGLYIGGITPVYG